MMPASCKHFTGVQHDACAAGVVYDAVRDDSPEHPTFKLRLPCFNCDIPCASRVFPTPEEVAAEEARWAAAMERVATARAAIVTRHGKARGLAGDLSCPNCADGTLRYSIAGNGHIHAACSTPDCCARLE